MAWARTAFRANYACLAQVKGTWDPENVFRANKNIARPTGAAWRAFLIAVARPVVLSTWSLILGPSYGVLGPCFVPGPLDRDVSRTKDRRTKDGQRTKGGPRTEHQGPRTNDAAAANCKPLGVTVTGSVR